MIFLRSTITINGKMPLWQPPSRIYLIVMALLIHNWSWECEAAPDFRTRPKFIEQVSNSFGILLQLPGPNEMHQYNDFVFVSSSTEVNRLTYERGSIPPSKLMNKVKIIIYRKFDFLCELNFNLEYWRGLRLHLKPYFTSYRGARIGMVDRRTLRAGLHQ